MGQATGNGQQATGACSGAHQCATVPASALAALNQMREAGFPAYLVGGCVRDSLLGREPGDWDITTAALPEQVEAVFAGERIIETGLKHGTVTGIL